VTGCATFNTLDFSLISYENRKIFTCLYETKTIHILKIPQKNTRKYYPEFNGTRFLNHDFVTLKEARIIEIIFRIYINPFVFELFRESSFLLC